MPFSSLFYDELCRVFVAIFSSLAGILRKTAERVRTRFDNLVECFSKMKLVQRSQSRLERAGAWPSLVADTGDMQKYRKTKAACKI